MEVIYCSQIIDYIINKKKYARKKKKTFWQLQRSPHSHKEQCLLGKRRTRKWENHTHLSLKKKIVVCIIHAHMHTLQHRKTQTRCSLWNCKVSFRKFFLLFFYLRICRNLYFFLLWWCILHDKREPEREIFWHIQKSQLWDYASNRALHWYYYFYVFLCWD